MRAKNRWMQLGLLGLALSVGFNVGCQIAVRDAVYTGVFDFIAGSVTDGLSTIVFGGK